MSADIARTRSTMSRNSITAEEVEISCENTGAAASFRVKSQESRAVVLRDCHTSRNTVSGGNVREMRNAGSTKNA